MDYHKNAPWTAVSRERLARMVIDDGVRRDAAAARFSVSAKTAAKWVARYRQFGAAGLADRSSRPHHSPRQTASSLVEKVLVLRRGHMPGYEIARRTGLSPASVSRILRRARLSRWRDLNPPPPVQRYEHPRPGDLLHLDIKGMTRFSEVSLRGDGRLRGKQQTSRLPGSACGRRRSLAHGLHPDAARSEGRNHHRLPALGRRVLRHATASACAPCSPTTAPATARSQFRQACQTHAASNTAAPDPTHPEPTARPSASSRPPCANGPMQNTGPTQSKEMLTCSLGPTTTTTNDPMVASTTSRPSAAPIPEQRLDHLQAPSFVPILLRAQIIVSTERI